MKRPAKSAKRDAWISYADHVAQNLTDAQAEVARLEGEVADQASGETVRQLRRRVRQLTSGSG